MTILDIDLNGLPVADEDDGPSTPLLEVEQPVIIIDDDDVIESSPRAFAEAAKNKSRNRNRSSRQPLNETIINYNFYINLEGGDESSIAMDMIEPPPKEPVFNCPICMGPLGEEIMSTRCGHIFCKNCIKTAINVQGKCPTCRKKVTVKQLVRVFLPSPI